MKVVFWSCLVLFGPASYLLQRVTRLLLGNLQSRTPKAMKLFPLTSPTTVGLWKYKIYKQILTTASPKIKVDSRKQDSLGKGKITRVKCNKKKKKHKFIDLAQKLFPLKIHPEDSTSCGFLTIQPGKPVKSGERGAKHTTPPCMWASGRGGGLCYPKPLSTAQVLKICIFSSRPRAQFLSFGWWPKHSPSDRCPVTWGPASSSLSVSCAQCRCCDPSTCSCAV